MIELAAPRVPENAEKVIGKRLHWDYEGWGKIKEVGYGPKMGIWALVDFDYHLRPKKVYLPHSVRKRYGIE